MRRTLGQLVGLAAAVGLTASTLGLSSIANARAANEANANNEATETVPAYEAIDSFTMLTRPWSWHRIDNDTLIVWTSPFQPYLVELSFPSHDLNFVEHIGVTSVGARVYAKFDSVQVRGFRYPIDAIYKLSRDEARNLERGT